MARLREIGHSHGDGTVVIYASWLKIAVSITALVVLLLSELGNVAATVATMRATQQQHSEELKNVVQRGEVTPLQGQIDRISARVDAIYEAVGASQ